MRHLVPQPISLRQDSPQVLSVKVTTHSRQGSIVGLTLKRVLLKEQEAALHAILRLPNNKNRITQSLPLIATLVILNGNNMVKPMTANLSHLLTAVFETALSAYVYEDLCC